MRTLLSVLSLLFNLMWISLVSADQIVVRIGATLPLTGRLAIVGQEARKGIELAVKDFSTAGVKLDVTFDDNQHNAPLAVASAKKLLDVDKVNLIISMWDMADVVAPIAEQRSAPHLAVRWNHHITERYKNTFTFESTYQSYVDSLIALLKRAGIDSVALITEEGQGWILAADYMKKTGGQSGIRIVGDERYAPLTDDFRGIILRATRHRPQMIILLSNPPYTETLIRQIKQSAPAQRFTGYFEIIDPKIVEGFPFAAQFQTEDWFVKRFLNQFGEAPRSRAAQIYDMIHIIALAAKKSSGSPSTQAIIETLSDLPQDGGAAGPFVLNSPRVVESKCVWKIAKNGEFQIYR
jgi:branched-chain amino acid transport system substrate-binding protein